MNSTISEVKPASALRYIAAEETAGDQWVSYMSSKEDGVLEERYRVPGDASSLHYDVNRTSGEETENTQIADGSGKVLIDFEVYAQYFGIRKTERSIALFFLFPDYENGSYTVVTISGGRLTRYGCTFAGDMLARVYGAEAGTLTRFVSDPLPMLDLLTSRDFDRPPDSCVLEQEIAKVQVR